MSTVPCEPAEPQPGAGRTACVITVSDRCAAGLAQDVSGPVAVQALAGYGLDVADPQVVPDGVDSVREAVHGALRAGARVIVTTGGTGVTQRDLTPEACEGLLTMRLPGIEEEIRRRGSQVTPWALLSRGVVGVCGRGPGSALLVNAPGSPGGVRDTIAVVGPLVTHLLEQIDGGDHVRQ